jgi:hypothetical protein
MSSEQQIVVAFSTMHVQAIEEAQNPHQKALAKLKLGDSFPVWRVSHWNEAKPYCSLWNIQRLLILWTLFCSFFPFFLVLSLVAKDLTSPHFAGQIMLVLKVESNRPYSEDYPFTWCKRKDQLHDHTMV